MRALRFEKERPQKALLAGLLAGTLAFLFHNLIDMDAYVPGIALLWWAMVGIVMIKVSNQTKKEKK
ncbi:MAG TPA: hypothetical protein ENH97_03225 [bacterium]|nr:hypothetical protein [bacterium]